MQMPLSIFFINFYALVIEERTSFLWDSKIEFSNFSIFFKWHGGGVSIGATELTEIHVDR